MYYNKDKKETFMYKIFTITLIFLLSNCSSFDFNSNPNLDLFFNESSIRITSPTDLTEQFIIDQFPLSIYFRDYLGIKKISIQTPHQTFNPTINIGTKAIVINQILCISNSTIPNQYPIKISYTDINDKIIKSNYALSIKALSSHFNINLPPNRVAAVILEVGLEKWRNNPQLMICSFTSGASLKKITVEGMGQPLKIFNNPANPLIIPFTDFLATPPSGSLVFNIEIYSEHGKINKTNIILS